mgnify:CR=1 FL=1
MTQASASLPGEAVAWVFAPHFIGNPFQALLTMGMADHDIAPIGAASVADGVRVVTTAAWASLFARNMFIRPKAEELAGFTPDYVILHAPKFQADPAIDGVRTSTAVAMSTPRILASRSGRSSSADEIWRI